MQQATERPSRKRKITVEDTTAPVITLEGNATIDLWVWETYTEDGATASDTLDGNLTGAITITGHSGDGHSWNLHPDLHGIGYGRQCRHPAHPARLR